MTNNKFKIFIFIILIHININYSKSQNYRPKGIEFINEITGIVSLPFSSFARPNVDSVIQKENHLDSIGKIRPYRFGIKINADNISKENLTIDLI